MRRSGIVSLAAALLVSGGVFAKEYFKGDRQQQSGYSLAVVTEGGKTIWLAGQTATVDDNGKSLAADFEGQVRQLFKQLDRTLQKAGGKLSDLAVPPGNHVAAAFQPASGDCWIHTKP